MYIHVFRREREREPVLVKVSDCDYLDILVLDTDAERKSQIHLNFYKEKLMIRLELM